MSRHPEWLLALGSVLLAQTALIVFLIARGRKLRHLAEKAQLLQLELAHASRAGTMGALTGALSHELNQPLAAIMSNAQAAQRFLDAPTPDLAEVRTALEDIVEDDRRAGDVIRKLRSFLERRELDLGPIDLERVVNDALTLVRPEANLRGVPLETDLAADGTVVRGDRTQLQQVVTNLLQNAIQVAAQASDPRVTIATGTDEATVWLTVRDRAEGIGDEALPRIFEPFFTTKAQGMGLGLSICRTIVTAHHGEISARNHENGGAIFELRLDKAE